MKHVRLIQCEKCAAAGPRATAGSLLEAVRKSDREAVLAGWDVNGPVLCPACRRARQIAAGVIPLAEVRA